MPPMDDVYSHWMVFIHVDWDGHVAHREIISIFLLGRWGEGGVGMPLMESKMLEEHQQVF